MPTCPNGHRSGTDDWCEVCGLRVSAPVAQPGPAAPGPVPPPPPPATPYTQPGPATVAVEPCPECGTPREGEAAFCEECRYNFLTHTTAQRAPAAPPPPPLPYARPPFPPPYERTSSRPSQINRPAEPLPPDATISGEALAGTPGPGGDDDDGDFVLSPPSGGRAARREAPAGPQTWTAVVGADRTYYAAMMARSGPDASGLYFPTYSPEQHVPLTGSQVTIGRRRHSTGEAPDIDLSRPPEDPGVSHRHAVLVRRADGGWSVVDQGSTNGTTVNNGEDAISPFQPVDLAEGDRVHVGAWTTITLRRG